MAKKNHKYVPENCEIALRELSEGYSVETLGAAFTPRVSTETVYEWIRTRPEFAEAVQEGKQLALKHLERCLKAKLTGEDSNEFDARRMDYNAIQFALKTRFHKVYSEKVQIDHTSTDGSMSPDKKIDYSKLSIEELKLMKKLVDKTTK